MSGLINLLSPLISNLLITNLNPLSRRKPLNYGRFAAYVLAFFFLISAYIIGCAALYSYLVPHCGEPLSLFILCLFLLATSLSLIGIGRFLKPKNPPSTDFASTFEKTVKHLSSDEVCRKLGPVILPTSFAALLAVGAVAAYFAYTKKDKS